MRMVSVADDTKLYAWLKDLTVYSSNFAELKDSKNSGSKIKYRVSDGTVHRVDFIRQNFLFRFYNQRKLM